MTFQHYILISSSYADGKRIAMDITSPDTLDTEKIQSILHAIREKCGNDVPLATQYLITDSADWNSVVEYDSFFEGIEVYDRLDSFIENIQLSRKLTGIDIAKDILSKLECTHTKLQKLSYLCYAEYLCSAGKKLFEDEIYAFTYGPVVASVYETCKKYHHEPIDSSLLVKTSVHEAPAKSKIMFSSDGANKLAVIDDTLAKYGHFSAKQLVEITHRESSPWQTVYSPSIPYITIDDATILTHHFTEQIV